MVIVLWAIWFLAGYVVSTILTTLRRVGVGVGIVKIAEIRSLELLSTAATLFYQAEGAIDLSAETGGDPETLKLIKNGVRQEYHRWQKEAIEILKQSMDPDFRTFREWETWDEAMNYLAGVKANNRLFINAIRAKKIKDEEKQ